MAKSHLAKDSHKRIDGAVEHFVRNRNLFEGFAKALVGYIQNDTALSPYIHFLKYRIKDPDHLRGKLVRKALDGRLIDASNLFDEITDLAGIRLIHLHSEQMREIHPAILAILEEQQLQLIGKPTANCWDVEYEQLFNELGFATQSRNSMYTTVDYIVQANQRTKVTCELQVRTLMDEVWGEVSHRVNYPAESASRTCQDLVKVLARLTSGCTRLVDSIFRSHHESQKPP